MMWGSHSIALQMDRRFCCWRKAADRTGLTSWLLIGSDSQQLPTSQSNRAGLVHLGETALHWWPFYIQEKQSLGGTINTHLCWICRHVFKCLRFYSHLQPFTAKLSLKCAVREFKRHARLMRHWKAIEGEWLLHAGRLGLLLWHVWI